MNARTDHLKCLVVPLSGLRMIMPNALAAEIVTLQDVDPVRNAPDWLVGVASWRGTRIPLVALDRFCGLDDTLAEGAGRFLIMHPHRTESLDTHYGIRLEALPRVETVARTAMESLPNDDALEHVTNRVRVGDRECVVPDLDAVIEGLAAWLQEDRNQG